MASVIVQVAWPLPSSVVVLVLQSTGLEFGSVTDQAMVPVGVMPGPVTAAVKVKLPPVTTPAALSVTVVVDGAMPTVAVESVPEPPL